LLSAAAFLNRVVYPRILVSYPRSYSGVSEESDFVKDFLRISFGVVPEFAGLRGHVGISTGWKGFSCSCLRICERPTDNRDYPPSIYHEVSVSGAAGTRGALDGGIFVCVSADWNRLAPVRWDLTGRMGRLAHPGSTGVHTEFKGACGADCMGSPAGTMSDPSRCL